MIKAHIVISAFILLLSSSSYAQSFSPVNRDSVKMQITDAAAPTLYSSLLQRFNSFDTTLTNDDYRLLYYGFVFQPAYSPYGENKVKEINAALADKDYFLAVKICDTILQAVPVSLNANYQKAVALYLQDKAGTAYSKYDKRYSKLLNAIASTGDGLTCRTAFKTIFIDDEYQIMFKFLQIKKYNGQALAYPCDRLSVEPSAYFKQNSVFFDTSETFLSMQDMFKDNSDKKSKKKKKGKNE